MCDAVFILGEFCVQGSELLSDSVIRKVPTCLFYVLQQKLKGYKFPAENALVKISKIAVNTSSIF